MTPHALGRHFATRTDYRHALLLDAARWPEHKCELARATFARVEYARRRAPLWAVVVRLVKPIPRRTA